MNLKELLKSNRWNASSISEKLGVSRSAVSYWQKGKTQPNAKHIKEIAVLCEVDCSIVVDAILETKEQAKVV